MAELVLENGERQGTRWRLRPGAQVLGRAEDAELSLSLPMVSRQQLQLFCGPDECRVLNLSTSNPTYLNGRPLHGEAQLQEGDLLGIGQLRLRYLTGPADVEPVPVLGNLVIRQAGRQERTIPLRDAVVTIGRDPTCTIHLDFPAISRHHLRLERIGSGWQVIDLRSSHGTEVDGRLIDRPTPLNAGSIIWLGDRLGNGVQLIMPHESRSETP